MDIKNLYSNQNLLLAWQRIAASKDARYKIFFRHILESYQLSFEKNLTDLSRRLKADEYKAQSPVIFYVPKPSGLQRPFTLLGIEDQIIFQALANLFAEKVRSRRKKLEGKCVFSNKLGQEYSPFFLEDWQKGFSQLKLRLKANFKKGYIWVATFDISAFYDTIPHELLLRILVPHAKGTLYERAKQWLKVWSSDKAANEHNHGIPQGPMASNFLAECILLSIDEKMSMQGAYFRYVDDIRILGKTELEVRKALVSLDILCKSIGLIPHSDKTSIRQVYSANELIEDIPEIKHYFEDEGSQTVSKQYAEKYILDAVNLNGKITVQDKTLLRYLLFRVPASDKILRIVLKIWEHFPEHTDAYVAFLENYQRDDEVISLSNRLLMDGYPYDYVQGELWKLLARMCTPSELEGIKELAIQTIKNSKSGHSSRLGAQIFLCKCDSSGLGDYEKWLIYEKKALIQALVAPHLTLQSVSGRLAGKAMLTRSTADSYLALLKPIIDAGLQLSDFRRDPAEFPFVAQYVYKAAGLSGHQIPRADAIGNLLIKRFSVKNWNKWKQLFQGEYRHAHMILKFADTYYDSHMSTWLNYQDTFNEILFMVFQDFLSTKNAPGVINLTDKNKKRIPYGILLRTPTLKIAYPNLSDDLIRIHNRRNKLPGSHAYDEKTGDKSRPLKKREQLTLKSYIDDALEEIIRIVESFGI